MSKKSKGVVLVPKMPYGIGVHEDAKARLKYQTLMQDYEELQKEADLMRSKLEASKQRKLILAAEVRFLRRRYKYLVKTKNTNSSKEETPVVAPNSVKRAKITKGQLLIGKEVFLHRLPSVPEASSKKKQFPLREAFPVSDQPRRKKSYGGKEVVAPMERMFGANDANLRNSTAAFDLNQDTVPRSLPTRAPIFDLNEISTGDEDFHGQVEANKFEEARKSLTRGININEEQQNDLKLSICRNAGESSSRGGKRKISWQDPVALRV